MTEQRGLVSPSLLSDIANAIRYKLSTNKTYKLSEMPAAINKIKTGDGVSYAILPASGYNMGGKIENIFFLSSEPVNELKDTKTLFSLPGGANAWSYKNGNNLYIYPEDNAKYSFYGSMDNAFAYCANLKYGIHTSNAVTNMRNAYRGCYTLNGQPVCSDTVIDMEDAYNSCYNINGTAACGNNVIYMTRGYGYCRNLNEAYVGPSVVYMSEAFRDCYNILNAVTNNNVVEMQYAYYNCQKLNSEPVCSPKTIHFYNTYYNCQNLTGNAVCGDNVVYFDHCYQYCYKLNGKAACGDKVLNMASTYEFCHNLMGPPACGASVNNLYCTYDECWDMIGEPVCGDNVLNMQGAYWACHNISGNPACGRNVYDMAYAYQNCWNLTGEPNIGPAVRNLLNAYYGCWNLTGTPVFGNNYGLSDITNCYYNCSNLNGGNVYLMQNQTGSYSSFWNALYNFNTNKRLNFFVLHNRIWDNTFKRNTNSYSILGKPITWENINYNDLPNNIPNNKDSFVKGGYYNNLYNMYVYQATGVVYLPTFTFSNIDSITIKTQLRELNGNQFSSTSIEPAVRRWEANNYIIEMYAGLYKWNYDCNNMFDNCKNLNLNLTELWGNGYNWTETNRFSNTFHNCQNVYGTPFCPNNVSGYMYQTYMGCTNITGKAACGDQITNMHSTYENCTSLEEAACGLNVLDMNRTYYGCSNLKKAACEKSVQRLGNTYRECHSLLSPIVENYVTYMDNTYRNCYNMIGSAVCGPLVTDMENCYAGCNNLTKAVCGPSVQTFRNAYNGCSNITGSIKLGPDVYNKMNGCFYGCDRLQTIYIPNTGVYAGAANNAFYRTNYNTRQNIIVNSLFSYNDCRDYGNILCNSIFGNDSTTPDYSTIEVEGENINVVRYCYNLEHNVYLYCTV